MTAQESDPSSREGLPPDETDVNLETYVSLIPEAKLRQYRAEWTDEEVAALDGNFRCDGYLFLICSEREVDTAEFRRAVEARVAGRGREGT
jgi:hypothetical protein